MRVYLLLGCLQYHKYVRVPLLCCRTRSVNVLQPATTSAIFVANIGLMFATTYFVCGVHVAAGLSTRVSPSCLRLSSRNVLAFIASCAVFLCAGASSLILLGVPHPCYGCLPPGTDAEARIATARFISGQDGYSIKRILRDKEGTVQTWNRSVLCFLRNSMDGAS